MQNLRDGIEMRERETNDEQNELRMREYSSTWHYFTDSHLFTLFICINHIFLKQQCLKSQQG